MTNVTVISWDNNSDVFTVEVWGTTLKLMIDSEFTKVFNTLGNEQTLHDELREEIVSKCHDFWHAQNDALEAQSE